MELVGLCLKQFKSRGPFGIIGGDGVVDGAVDEDLDSF